MTGIAAESGVGREVRSDLVDKGRRLIQFLAAAQRLRLSPVRTLDTYAGQDGAVFWLGQAPEHPAVSSAARVEAPDPATPFLAVDRVASVPAPAPDPQVEPWLDGSATDPERSPALRVSRTVDGPNGPQVVRLEESSDVQAAFDRWLGVWSAWAERELVERPVRQLYRDLFTAFNTLTGQPELYEMVLAVGCLAWKPEDHEAVRRHVLVAPATLEFDEASGTLAVLPGQGLEALSVELDMLDPSLAPAGARHQELAERARSLDAHPLEREAVGDLLRSVVNTLHPDGRYDASDSQPSIGSSPVLAFAPAVVLRRRSQAGLLHVFEAIESAIAESGSVPAGLMPLVDPNYVPPVEPDSTPGAMVAFDEEVFLPLPLNDRQLDIVQRVDRQAQTLVQGPPGTGKTHLAAALISHLLAQGKRVLVTAQTDRALKEVRGKLPEEIKPLAVAVLGSDLTDMADLKVAVEGISNRSNEGDPVARDRQMEAIEAACIEVINTLRARRAELRNRLVEARSGEVAERSFLSYRGTLATIARTYREEHDTFAWLNDYAAPAVEAPSPLTNAEAQRWMELLQQPDPAADQVEAAGQLTDPSLLPTPEQFAAMVTGYDAADAVYATFSSIVNHAAFEGICALDASRRAVLQEQMDALARKIGAFEQRRDSWMVRALSDIRSGRAATWGARAWTISDHLAHAVVGLRQLNPATRVVLAEGADRPAIASLATHLRNAVAAGRQVPLQPDGSVKIGAFTAKVIKDSRPLFDAVRIDGRPLTTVEQLTHLLVLLEVERYLDALDNAWPSDIVVPAEDSPHERYQWHATELRLLQSLLDVGQDVEVQSQRLSGFAIPQPDWNDLEAILEFARLVDAASAREARASALAPLNRVGDATASVARQPGAAPVCTALVEAVQRHDAGAYATAYARLQHLLAVRDKVDERESLTARVRVVAPLLTSAVTATPDDSEWCGRLGGLESAWDWARTGAWILAQESVDVNDIETQLDRAEDAIRRQIEKLAATRAWRHALSASRITGQARADLNNYVRQVKSLGKGTGKYAAVRRTEIRRAMDNCRPAVPVWIMPIYRIAEQLRVSENMFDVVIVDEASQAGLEATFLQYLAPKIVVIGDDKQVSPAAVGVDQQQLRDLASQYLYDHRYKDSWQDPKLSLFDAAAIWYGAKRTLVEHRRCVPEIIGFSNRIAYEPENIRLIPVRQFGAERLEPIKTVHVGSGYEAGATGSKTNRPEAEAIADQLVECLADPAYDGKTFGVISLLGPTQAKLINNLLLDRVAPEEWAARDLRCGDAAAFQGSERDVMFLSMVSAPAPGQRMNARVDLPGVQRYNVAASRAKDQMWVFHSVALNQLTNPQDMRFQLLDYCYNTVPGLQLAEDGMLAGLVPEDERTQPFDSLFEQRVHNRLIERGYTVIPQYEAMGYRIDLAVVGATTMLAVECDGDFWHGPDQYLADLARERDLRRCGWEFFRIRESAFYVDAHAALAPLWTTLDNLNIGARGQAKPGGDEESTEEGPVPNDSIPGQGEQADSLECEVSLPDTVFDDESSEEPAGESVDVDASVDGFEEAAAESQTHLDRAEGSPYFGSQSDQAKGRRFAKVGPEPVTDQTTVTPASLRLMTGDHETLKPAPTVAVDLVNATVRSAGLRPYPAFSGWAPPVHEASRKQIELTMVDIIAHEGPILGARAHSAYVAASGGRRVGHVIAAELDAALSRLVRRGEVLADDPLNRRQLRLRTFRLPSQPTVVPRELGPRNLEEIPPLELAALLKRASHTTGWNEDSLFREGLRLLGRVRLTAPAQRALAEVIPLALTFEEAETAVDRL